MRCNPHFTLPLRYLEQQRCLRAAQLPHLRPDIFKPGQAHTLLTLPNEVINLIYHNVVLPDEVMDLSIGGEGPLCHLPRHHNNGTKSCHGFSPHCTGIFNLLFLNRQIRRDTVGLYKQKTISLHYSFWFRELLRGASKVGLADVLCKWELYRSLPVTKGTSIYRWQRLSPKQRAKKVQKWLRIEVEKWRLREVTVESGWKVAFDKAKVDVE